MTNLKDDANLGDNAKTTGLSCKNIALNAKAQSVIVFKGDENAITPYEKRDKNNKVCEVGSLDKNGHHVGYFMRYTAEGVREEWTYTDDGTEHRIGIFRIWNKKEKVVEDGTFSGDGTEKKIKEFTKRAKNGNLRLRCHYNNDSKLDGTYQEWNDKQELIKDCEYKNGEMTKDNSPKKLNTQKILTGRISTNRFLKSITGKGM